MVFTPTPTLPFRLFYVIDTVFVRESLYAWGWVKKRLVSNTFVKNQIAFIGRLKQPYELQYFGSFQKCSSLGAIGFAVDGKHLKSEGILE